MNKVSDHAYSNTRVITVGQVVSDQMFMLYVNNQIGCGVSISKIREQLAIEPVTEGFDKKYLDTVENAIKQDLVKESLSEILCRRLLTDHRLVISDSTGKGVVLKDFLNGVRCLPTNERNRVFYNFIGSPAYKILAKKLLTWKTGPSTAVSGWNIMTKEKEGVKWRNHCLKTAMEMAFLIDPLSIVFVDAIQGNFCANALDLPENFVKVIEAMNKIDYQITTLKNWAFAQTFPYVDENPLMFRSIYAGLDPQARWLVLSPDLTYWRRLSLESFEVAFTNGLLNEDISLQEAPSYGWECIPRASMS